MSKINVYYFPSPYSIKTLLTIPQMYPVISVLYSEKQEKMVYNELLIFNISFYFSMSTEI